MKKIAVLAACAGMVLAGSALAETIGEKTGINSALGISPTTKDFVDEAAKSDMFEIESSKMAVDKSDDQATKDFANQMITDHTKTSEELKAAVAGDTNITIPSAMDSSQDKMIEELKGLNGADFTKKYHDMQAEGHEDAVSLFERYAKGGENEALKNFASTALPALQHHLQLAQALDK
jgi:putative membrane protein